MSDSALASVTGLIPVAVASGVAVKTSKALLDDKKKSKKRRSRQSKKSTKRSRATKRVTKPRKKSQNELKRWLG